MTIVSHVLTLLFDEDDDDDDDDDAKSTGEENYSETRDG